jgi:phospholipid transport system substrate-binding protein
MIALIFTALFLIATNPIGSASDDTADPMLQIKRGVSDVLLVFQDHQMPLRDRREKLRALAAQYFDFEDMAKSAMGYHWRELTTAQRDQFVPLFTVFIQDAYLSKLQDYAVRKVQEEAKTAKIDFTGESFDGSDYAEVFSDVVLQDQKDPVRITYLMHRRGSTWRIYDITVDAISVIANYRNQFNRAMNNEGYDKLVASLAAKRDQLEQYMAHPQGSGDSKASGM